MQTILALDPGTKLCGWALINLPNWTIIDSGRDEWSYVRDLIRTKSPDGVAIERTVVYSRSNQNSGGDIHFLVPMMEHTGRILEICDQLGIEVRMDTRPDVIKKLTGHASRSKKLPQGHKIKAHMQQVVMNILNLPGFIRPQHANDAVCVAIAQWHPGYTNGRIP